jgi:hypothetical protein
MPISIIRIPRVSAYTSLILACLAGADCRKPSLGIACVSALRASILHACALRLPMMARLSDLDAQAGDDVVSWLLKVRLQKALNIALSRAAKTTVSIQGLKIDSSQTIPIPSLAKDL